MSLIRKNLIYNTLLSVSQVLFPIITFPYSSRILGPKGIGAVSFVDSLTQYFILICALGIPTYGVREVSRVRHDRNALNKLFSELLSIHLIATAVCFVFYFIAGIYSHENASPALFLIGATILLSNVFIIEWFFQGIERFKFITTRILFLRIFFIVLLFAFVRTEKDVTIYYALTLFTFLGNAIANFYYSRNYVSITFKQLDLKKHLKPLFFLVASNLAVSAYILMDNIILGFLADVDAVAYYATAVKLVKIPISFINALGIVLLPQLATAYDNDPSRFNKLIGTSFNYVISLTVPICAGFFICAPMIIHLFAGDKFDESIFLIRILSPIVFLIGLSYTICLQLLTPHHKEKAMLKMSLVGMVISISLNFVLIPLFSDKGAAFSNLVTETVVFGIALFLSWKFFKINLDGKLVLFACLAAATFFPIYYLVDLLDLQMLIKLPIIIALCGMVYLGMQVFIFRNSLFLDVITSLKQRFIK
jgi:O-antigen/teichoic acid export membrane protein